MFNRCSSFVTVVIPDSVTSNRRHTRFLSAEVLNRLSSRTVSAGFANKYFPSAAALNRSLFRTVLPALGGVRLWVCSLTSAEIPDGVTSIETLAFYACTNLASVIIPGSVTGGLGPMRFGSNRLSSVTIGSNRGFVFSGNSQLRSVEILDTVTSIREAAFQYCESLTSVVIPDSVESIGRRAFGYCTRLASVVIGDSVTSIGDEAFYRCTSLNTITIPYSVTTMGTDVFKYCGCDEELYQPGVQLSRCTVIEKQCTNNNSCGNATHIRIPEGTITIEEDAFKQNIDLVSIHIPDSVTSIRGNAFLGCSSLCFDRHTGQC